MPIFPCNQIPDKFDCAMLFKLNFGKRRNQGKRIFESSSHNDVSLEIQKTDANVDSKENRQIVNFSNIVEWVKLA